MREQPPGAAAVLRRTYFMLLVVAIIATALSLAFGLRAPGASGLEMSASVVVFAAAFVPVYWAVARQRDRLARDHEPRRTTAGAIVTRVLPLVRAGILLGMGISLRELAAVLDWYLALLLFDLAYAGAARRVLSPDDQYAAAGPWMKVSVGAAVAVAAILLAPWPGAAGAPMHPAAALLAAAVAVARTVLYVRNRWDHYGLR